MSLDVLGCSDEGWIPVISNDEVSIGGLGGVDVIVKADREHPPIWMKPT